MSNALFYVGHQGQQMGPFSEDDIRRQLASAALSMSDVFWTEGMKDWQALGTRFANHTATQDGVVASPATENIFFRVSTARLVLMSVLSLGLFEAYWMYRNWKYLANRDQLDIKPFWRSVFAIFFCHDLFKRMGSDSRANRYATAGFSASGLAVTFVVLAVVTRGLDRLSDGPWTLLAMLMPTWAPLIPIQNYVNAVNAKRSPGSPEDGWTTGQVVLLVLGLIMWGLALVGLAAS